MSYWVSIKDYLPLTQKPVLITDGREVNLGKYCYHCNIFEIVGNNNTMADCSHWQSLPTPPNKQPTIITKEEHHHDTRT